MGTRRGLAATALVLFLVPGAAQAGNGRILMTWGDTCTPLVANITPTAGPVSLMFSEIGNDQTHRGYQVRFLLAAADGTPDAWRFDAAGCQGSSLLAIHVIPPASAAKTCPPFQGINPSMQIRVYDLAEMWMGYNPGVVRGILANTYPGTSTTSGATRYFLAQFVFDHSLSVAGPTTPGLDCGRFEAPICIMLLQGPVGGYAGTSSYLRASDGVELPFDRTTEDVITVHGPQDCLSVPVRSTTWGEIKGRYRD